MKKTTLLLLVPMYLFTNAVATNSDESKIWSRDDVVNSIEAREKKRELRSLKREEDARKIMESRDGVQPIDSVEVAAPTKSKITPPPMDIKKSAETQKIIVEHPGMTIEIKKREEKKIEAPSITIEVSEQEEADTPSMIIEVKEKPALSEPQATIEKITMELVKINRVEPVVEKNSAYPVELIRLQEHKK